VYKETCLSPKIYFLFSSSVDATIRCWDLDEGRCIREFAGHLNSVFPLMYIPADDDDEEEPLPPLRGTDDDGENADDLQRSTSGGSSSTSSRMKIDDILVSGSTASL